MIDLYAKRLTRRLSVVAGVAAAMVFMTTEAWGAASVASGTPELRLAAAARGEAAMTVSLLASAQAGTRLVAVGEQGTVLLSDDGGKTIRQAALVPVSSTLTSVSFASPKVGWAVGHWGVILKTEDGGETWQLQRSELSTDQPLFAVQALSDKHCVAVGLWSLVLRSDDGGSSWARVKPGAADAGGGERGGKQADLNLYSLFRGASGELWATAEQGRLLRSADEGRSWAVLDTGYKGSLWAGAILSDGAIVVGGLRGTMLASHDGGLSWRKLVTDTQSSITSIEVLPDGNVVASALDGVVLFGKPTDERLRRLQVQDKQPFTGLLRASHAEARMLTKSGVRSVSLQP